MNTNVFENGRSPEFIEAMKQASRDLNLLQTEVGNGTMTLDEAAKKLMESPGGWNGTFADAKRHIAIGLKD